MTYFVDENFRSKIFPNWCNFARQSCQKFWIRLRSFINSPFNRLYFSVTDVIFGDDWRIIPTVWESPAFNILIRLIIVNLSSDGLNLLCNMHSFSVREIWCCTVFYPDNPKNHSQLCWLHIYIIVMIKIYLSVTWIKDFRSIFTCRNIVWIRDGDAVGFRLNYKQLIAHAVRFIWEVNSLNEMKRYGIIGDWISFPALVKWNGLKYAIQFLNCVQFHYHGNYTLN